MKHFFAILLTAAAILAATVSVSAQAESGYIRGDADSDGAVTVLDATVIQRVLVDLAVNSFSETAADVDGDGLSILDATAIQRFVADYADPYGIGAYVNAGEPATDPATEPVTQPQTQKPTRDPDELPFVPA